MRPSRSTMAPCCMIWVVVAICWPSWACKSGSKSERIRRSSGEAAVEVVTPPTIAPRSKVSSAEREPNDEAADATALELDIPGRGRIAQAVDVDRFRLSVARPGALTVTVSAIAAVDLVVELREVRASADVVVAKSDRGGANVLEGIGGYPAGVGRYDVVVRSFVKAAKSRKRGPSSGASDDVPSGAGAAVVVTAAPSEEYEVVATLREIPGQAQEIEPNFDVGTASDLAVGETVGGVIGWSGDVDVWKVATEVLGSDDAIDVELSAVEGLALTLEMKDGMGRSQVIRKGARGQPLAVSGWVAKAAEAAPPFLYLVVKADRSHPQLGYQLRLGARVITAADEREPNDRPDLAQPLIDSDGDSDGDSEGGSATADGTVLHARWETGDVDCFALAAASSPRQVEVVVQATRGTALVIELVAGDRVIATSTSTAPTGTAYRLVGDVAAKQPAMIRVRGAATAGGNGSYDLSWAQVSGDAMPPEEGEPSP
jgi:hypothetical protein